MKRIAQFGVVFLGAETWVAFHDDTPSVLSVAVGCVGVAILAGYFVYRLRGEILATKEDSRRARERHEAPRRGRRTHDAEKGRGTAGGVRRLRRRRGTGPGR